MAPSVLVFWAISCPPTARAIRYASYWANSNASCDSESRCMPWMPADCTSPLARCRRLPTMRSEEHTSELQSQSNLVCRLLLEKKKKENNHKNKMYHENIQGRMT